LREDVLHRLGRIRVHADQALRTSDPAIGISFAVMELDSLWIGVSRSLFLSTAFTAKDGSGARLQLSKVPRAHDIDEALTHAIRRCTRRYKPGSTGPWRWPDEPLWWKPQTLMDALDEIGASNYAQVVTALGIAPAVFADLHAFRNFYAHRGKDTRSLLVPVLRSLNFPTTETATRALSSPLITAASGVRPQPLILDWIDDIEATVTTAI